MMVLALPRRSPPHRPRRHLRRPPTRAAPSSTTIFGLSTTKANVEIVVYDRAILLFTAESEAVRRIHQVCCRLDELATAAALIGSRRVDPGAWASPMAATYTYSEGRRCRRQRRRPPHPYRCSRQSRT